MALPFPMRCDIWTLARSELFLDEKPCYLEVACRAREWPDHAPAVRRLCRNALEVRRSDRRYILWLKQQLGDHFSGSTRMPLFDGLASPIGNPDG